MDLFIDGSWTGGSRTEAEVVNPDYQSVVATLPGRMVRQMDAALDHDRPFPESGQA